MSQSPSQQNALQNVQRGAHIWWNGKLVASESAKVSLYAHALHYGTGAFEGIRAYKQTRGGGAIFRLREHIERLFDSLKILGLESPYTVDDICRASVETCKVNGYEECYIRPLVFIGDGPTGVDPGANPPIDFTIMNWVWGKYLGDKGVQEGVRLKVSSFIRPHPNSIMTKGKITGQYVTGTLAKREAKRSGYDEALLLDPQGYLSEGSGENLFIVKSGVVKTTPLTSILAGITRRTIIEHLRAKNYRVEEQTFTRDELWSADEAFLTGTAAEITPIQSVDDRKIGAGKPGPITTQILKDYMAMVRGDVPEYGKSWLTPIR